MNIKVSVRWLTVNREVDIITAMIEEYIEKRNTTVTLSLVGNCIKK